MYTDFFGLTEKPFSLTPNPRFAFYSDTYRAALDQLIFALEQKEGFLLLTGRVGTGKTTLCRDLFERLPPDRYSTALVFNPFLNGQELLQTLLSEFGCTYTPTMSRKELLDRLNRYLLSQLVKGRTCVVVFDEAQHLSSEYLEQIRVLSNLETDAEKLLQIVLVGQPELRKRIEQDSLAQLDQRVSMRLSLRSLTHDETERFIYHRLNLAGARGRIHLTRPALRLIHESAQGIPRLVNLMCDRALLAGYVERSWTVEPRHVVQALRAIRGLEEDDEAPARLGQPRSRVPVTAAVAAALILVAGAALLWWQGILP